MDDVSDCVMRVDIEDEYLVGAPALPTFLVFQGLFCFVFVFGGFQLLTASETNCAIPHCPGMLTMWTPEGFQKPGLPSV